MNNNEIEIEWSSKDYIKMRKPIIENGKIVDEDIYTIYIETDDHGLKSMDVFTNQISVHIDDNIFSMSLDRHGHSLRLVFERINSELRSFTEDIEWKDFYRDFMFSDKVENKDTENFVSGLLKYINKVYNNLNISEFDDEMRNLSSFIKE